MTETPFMPKATAVWLVENTTLTFKQIAEFCNLHELEIKGIADGDVAKGIKAYNPILAGQLSREEVEICSKDPNKKLKLVKNIEKVEYITVDASFERGLAKEHTINQCCNYLIQNNFEMIDFLFKKVCILFRNKSYHN